MARQRAAELQLSENELVIARDQLDALHDELYVLACAVEDTERDLAAALQEGGFREEGPDRNLFATRMHLRASPKLLAGINKHLQAIMDLLLAEAVKDREPDPEDQHLSLTMALLPLKGRGRGETHRGG